MSIRAKVILVVLPLIIATGVVVAYSASLLARSGITRIAVEALGFKAQELRQYADNQWQLLINNNLETDPEYQSLTEEAIASYASTLVQRESEKIFATMLDGSVAFQSGEAVEPSSEEQAALAAAYERDETGWVEFQLAGVARVGQAFVFEPLEWRMVVSETEEAFFGEVEAITRQSGLILLGAILVATTLLLLFSNVLTRPIQRLVGTMRTITEENDLSKRVQIQYRDEIGTLGKTFNVMVDELEQAYDQIKSYAYQAVLSKRREAKIRNIFQKYVPNDIIDQFFTNPDSMLVGKTGNLAILFTDIRSFTTISESFEPEALVQSLNRYFEMMVDIIVDNGGIVDKYIGDAIMAFFGAPVERADDALRAVTVGVKMKDAVRNFNRAQQAKGLPPFNTGIGINYGPVVVGNIGSERKMDYTVIGDMVNLASRLEGLTKPYKQELLFSESVHRFVSKTFPCRFIDRVQVKGKTVGERIYTAESELTPQRKQLWERYDAGIEHFFARRFTEAAGAFEAALEINADDAPTKIFLERSQRYATAPPPADWDGTEVMTEK
jgi:class 3 adenylate cyclase/HAMP domain-containing protein